MGLGDNCMNILAKIISKNSFSYLDLSKNNFSDIGLRRIVPELRES